MKRVLGVIMALSGWALLWWAFWFTQNASIYEVWWGFPFLSTMIIAVGSLIGAGTYVATK